MSAFIPGDPDLPSLNATAMPAAPSASDSEDDSRLFWVPARLHPELAPKEFKSFLESKANQIKRRSGESPSFTDDSSWSGFPGSQGVLRGGSDGGLHRKRSMLSRQIDNSNGRAAEGYQDGAERLERKRSKSRRSEPLDPDVDNLEELENLVTDAVQLNQLSLEDGTGPGEDVILPSAPGRSLRRATRTQYRRGSTKTQPIRGSFARRSGRPRTPESVEGHGDVSTVPARPESPMSSAQSSKPAMGISRSSTDPFSSSSKTTNFSRPGARGSPSPSIPPDNDSSSSRSTVSKENLDYSDSPQLSSDRQWHSRLSSHGRSSLQISPENQTVPRIVLETPKPAADEPPPSRVSTSHAPATSNSAQDRLTDRKSSGEEGGARSPSRQLNPLKQPSPLNTDNSRSGAVGSHSNQSLEHMSSNPSPLPGNDTNTNNLSFIPTYSDDKKFKDIRKDDPKKSSWGWLLGKEESENKDKRLETAHNKSKAKITKPPDKHDNTRLDVLQNSIEGGKGRESLVLDRTNLKLEDERKKDSVRKTSGGDSKKEKDSLFSSIFGGGKKHKGDRDISHRKHPSGGHLSPDPPHRVLKPDVDYNWTRFSILEERAIYRMAHIKLANPRRALYSQVLLSNFMYSYLAKVQQMHPQMNLPTSAKQQKKQQQQQLQDQQSMSRSDEDYYRYQQGNGQHSTSYGSSASGPGAENDEDSSMYDYDDDGRRPSSRGSKGGLENGGGGRYGSSYGGGYNSSSQHSDFGSSLQGDDDDDDMW